MGEVLRYEHRETVRELARRGQRSYCSRLEFLLHFFFKKKVEKKKTRSKPQFLLTHKSSKKPLHQGEREIENKPIKGGKEWDHPWDMYGICTGYVRDIYGTTMEGVAASCELDDDVQCLSL